MCIAIVKPQGKTITDEQLKNCFDNNPDGAGIAFAKDNTLYILKGIFDKDEFVKSVRNIEKVAQGAMLIHCRISTSGLIDKNNCHPHVVNGNTVLIHNGVLDIDVPADSKVSDTVIFVEEYLKKLPNNFMSNKPVMKLIEMAIGSGNKFCFLDNKGEFQILNESAGTWDNGIWYSNSTYSYQKVKYDYSNYCYGTNYWDMYWHDSYKRYYDDDEEENILNTNYEKKPTFSKNQIKKIKKKIRNISDKIMYEIGEFPLYNPELRVFEPYDEHRSKACLILDEISPELQEEWEYEYEIRFGSLKKAV